MSLKFFAGAILFAALMCSPTHAQTNVDPAWTHLAHATVSDHVTDLWVNAQGESYQFGNISFLAGNPALDGMMLVKVDANGQELWRRFYHPQTNDYQLFAGSVVGDGQGNIFLVYTDDFRYTDLNSTRIAVKKIDAQGNELWSNFYTDVVENLVESPVARSGVYKNGTLYFASGTGGTDPGDDMDAMVVKIDGATGTLVQKMVFNSTYDSDDFFRRVEVGEDGSVWAIGRSRGYMYQGGLYSNYDANVVKFDANGVLQWEHRENGTSNNVDFGINIAIDAQGNCYTSNQLRMIGINQHRIQIQKIAPDGSVAWTHFYQGSSSGYNHDQPILILPNGNVVFSASNADGIVARALNGQTGDLLWMQNYNRSAAGASNRPYDMKADSLGNIYVTGESRDNTPFGNGFDVVTLKYNSAGELQWLSNYNRGNYDSMGEYGVALHLDASQNVYVTGHSQLNEAGNYDSDFLLLQYGSGLMARQEHKAFALSHYPNPVRDWLMVRHNGQAIHSATLVNVSGQTVRHWDHPEPATTGYALNLEGVAQGAYVLKVQGESGSAVLKVLKN